MASPFRLVHSETTRRTRAALLSQAARPMRFAITGGLAGFTQLVLLKVLLDHGWQSLLANGVAFLVSAQINFVLSNLFTWRDRMVTYPIWRRWLLFHGSIASMAVVNMLAFAAARTVLPDLAASAAGIGVAAIGNFIIGDCLVFRTRRHVLPVEDPEVREPAA